MPFISSISCIFIVVRVESFAAVEPKIRVLVFQGKELQFKADNSRPLIVRGIAPTGKTIKSFNINLENGQLRYSINGNSSQWRYPSKNAQIRIWTRDPRGTWLGKRRFAGELRLVDKNNSIYVINYLKIEKYLKSVVGSEMPKDWPIEALKAQAVASRTYALHQLKKKSEYDLDSTVSSQVYLGVEAETARTIQAVNSTRSIVMLHNGRLIDAVFHSSSGGQTESSIEVWGKYRPYLKSVLDYDQQNPSYKWEKRIEQKKLSEIFKKIGGFNAIRIQEKTNTDRIKIAKIYGPKGVQTLTGKEIRNLFNLKSTLVSFEIIPEVDNSIVEKNESYIYGQNVNWVDKEFLIQPNRVLVFNDRPPRIQDNNFLLVKGSGAGHGVGLSQWGAKTMAEQGASFRRILRHFYTGIQITTF